MFRRLWLWLGDIWNKLLSNVSVESWGRSMEEIKELIYTIIWMILMIFCTFVNNVIGIVILEAIDIKHTIRQAKDEVIKWKILYKYY